MSPIGQLRELPMDIPCYVINLDRSKARLEAFANAADTSGLKFSRVAAIDGISLPIEQWVEFDAKKFGRTNGRIALPGEYGCYASHIKALRQFIVDGGSSCVIFEDDALPGLQTSKIISELASRFENTVVVVRLVVHRHFAFEPLSTLEGNVSIGQCWFGPNGSAAAYFLTRLAAITLLEAVTPGFMPYDTFLERQFQHKVPSFVISPNALPVPQPPNSDIGSTHGGAKYRKWPWYRRSGALLFRTIQLFGRLVQCLLQRKLPKSQINY